MAEIERRWRQRIRAGLDSSWEKYVKNETVTCRFKDRDEDDARVWQARQLANGRWRGVGRRGPGGLTYATYELELLTSEYRVTWVIRFVCDVCA
ncbi:hypothetical protein ACNQVK_03270 [Mycobacterium sp. 134]|uniref:hypothetical protein n=1 Tax=Mycobacterium sp. 134 TaxID=3400425 RepID=UPI003AAB419D